MIIFKKKLIDLIKYSLLNHTKNNHAKNKKKPLSRGAAKDRDGVYGKEKTSLLLLTL